MVARKAGQPAMRFPVVARTKVIIWFAIVTICVAGLAYYAGTFVRSPTANLGVTSQAVVPVFTDAQIRTVYSGLNVQASVTQGSQLDVQAPSVSGVDRLIVTKQLLNVGSRVTNGTVIALVSNRPLIALTLSIPLYRDLHDGDTGPDVAAIRRALGLSPTGSVDSALITRIRAIYRSLGVQPPGWPGEAYIDESEIVAIPISSFQATVSSAASVGATVSTNHPVATLTVGPTQVDFRADVSEVSSLKQGDPVTIVGSDGVTRDGTVTHVGGFVEGSQISGKPATASGYDIVVTPAVVAGQPTLQPGTSATVRSKTPQKASLAVPMLAIRQDDNGAYVIVRRGKKQVHVSVRVVAQANGWASVVASKLAAGDPVQVQP